MLPSNFVFSGGGVKGSAFVGAASVLFERYSPMYLAGTSAGSIVAALLCCYSPAEVKALMDELDYSKFVEKASLPARAWGLITRYGMYKGDYLSTWIKEKLEARNVRTFKDLVVNPFHEDPRFRYRLSVMASELTTRRCVTFPEDAGLLGYSTEDMPVWLAVRASAALPLFYQPVRNEALIFVDGGVFDNFPVDLYDEGGLHPTIGLKLFDESGNDPVRVEGAFGIITVGLTLIECLMAAQEKRHIHSADYDTRTVDIDSLGIKTAQFDIQPSQRDALFGSGVTAAQAYLVKMDTAGDVHARVVETLPDVIV